MNENLNLRQLSPFEKFLWLLDYRRPLHFSVSAQVEGRTTVEEWRAALKALQQRHPLLSASIELDANGAPYFQKQSGATIPLRVVKGSTLQQLESEVAKEIAMPFGDTKAPLLRATLLHEEQRSLIILIAHHAIADAIALACAIRDLVRSLAGKTLEPLPVPPSHEEALGIIDKARLAKPGGNGKNGASYPIVSFDSKLQKLVPQVKARQLTRELTGNLRARARKENTSVNGAIASAIVCAMNELEPRRDDDPFIFAMPISTRNLLNLGEQCAIYTDGGPLDLNTEEPASFWQLARRAKCQFTDMQSLEHITDSRRQLSQILEEVNTPEAATDLASKVLNAHVVQSNLGALPLETQCGHLKLQAMWGPAMLMRAEGRRHFLGVATVNESLSFLYSSFAPIPQLLERLETILAASCAE
jgi:hypothetical protein